MRTFRYWSADEMFPAQSRDERRCIFSLRDVAKTYVSGEVRVNALENLNPGLCQNEFVALLGASGSGKSTLLNILGGLYIPASGTLSYPDHDLTAADDTELALFYREQ